MTILPGDFLDLAESMIEEQRELENKDESKIRTSISRAYFSVFHYAKEVIPGTDRSKSDVHMKIINYFDELNQYYISERLTILRTWRNKSDYNINIEVYWRKAYDLIMLAKNLIPHIEDIIQG